MLAVLLHGTAQSRNSIKQATVFLDAYPGFGTAHFYQGLSGAELGEDLPAALADLTVAIDFPEVSETDRSAAIDIFILAAINTGEFASALEQLDRQREKDT